MTVVVNDLIQPLGELERGLFPGDTTPQLFEDRLSGYLTDAEAKVEEYEIATGVDAATRAWVYYRAYSAKGTQLLAAPRDASIEGQGSRKYEQEQADGFFALAERWRAEFDVLIPVANAADPAVKSGYLQSVYGW